MRSPTLAMALLSLVLHGVAWASVARRGPRPAPRRIEVEVVRRSRPPAPAPPAPARAPAPPPRPERRQAALPRPALPPPPLAQAPPQPAAAPRPLPRVGISLGSTVASGGFAMGVGNTAHGKAEEIAADPASVRPYAGGIASPRPSVPPRPLDLPRIEYPAGARKAGAEGRVLLLLRIDATGAVAAVRVLDAPEPSLGAAAAEGARRFRFAPALAGGQPVEAEIRFTYTFLLE